MLPDAVNRIITIPAPMSGGVGVFDKLPKGVADFGTANAKLEASSTAFFGILIRAFLPRLIKKWEMPRRRVPKWVNRCIRKFVKVVGVDRNNGEALRVAKIFGLIFAAGCLAKSWGILPRNLRIGRAVVNCYRAHLSRQGLPQSSAADCILEFEQRHRHQFIDLRPGRKHIDDVTYSNAWGFLRAGPRGGLELLIPTWRMRSEIPDYQRGMWELHYQGRARVEGGKQPKLTVKVDIRGDGKPDRFYCIILEPPSSLSEGGLLPSDLDPPLA